MRKIISLALLLACVISCSIENGDDDSTSLFPTPVLPTESEPETDSPILEPIQPVPEPEPVIIEPGPVPPHDGARDLVAPKLVTSSVVTGQGDVDVDLDVIRLSFNEEVSKSNLKVARGANISLRWTLSINGKEVLLRKLDGIGLKAGIRYSIIGTVEDEHQNARVILISFETSQEAGAKDNLAPRLIRSTINHGDRGVAPDTERFVFTFDEEIHRADIKLINNERNTDLQWTTLIDGERVILLRLPDEGKRMMPGELHTIQLRWADAAGNWEPENAGVIRVITFVTEIKE